MIRVMPAGLNRGGSLLRMRSNLHQVLGAMSGEYVVVVDGPQVPGPVPVTQLLSMADATIVVVDRGVDVDPRRPVHRRRAPVEHHQSGGRDRPEEVAIGGRAGDFRRVGDDCHQNG